MITKYIDRPNNFLINRLGKGADWKTLLAGSTTPRVYGFLNKIMLTLYIKITFKSGEIFKTHMFFNNLFYFKKSTPLPVVKTAEDLNKLYRQVRLKSAIRFKAKRNFLARKFIKYLNISDLVFFRSNDYLVVLVYMYIPEPIKRFDYLKGINLSKGPNNSRVIKSKLFFFITKTNSAFKQLPFLDYFFKKHSL